MRNWDYRFCWLRDATFTLLSLLNTGYLEEARAWRAWLMRAVAGRPAETQIMYGIAGERRLSEWEVPWLPGYEGSKPVRIGNAASGQLQLDVFGEVIDALYQARMQGLVTADPSAWGLQQASMSHLELIWSRPDEGIWEVRGGAQHFTYSKVMCWVAFDRVITAAERFGWGQSKAGPGRGFGIAVGTEKGGNVATCAEVAVDRSTGRVQVIRIVSATPGSCPASRVSSTSSVPTTPIMVRITPRKCCDSHIA